MCFDHGKKTQEKNINEASDGKLPSLLKGVIFLKKNKAEVVVKKNSFPRTRDPLNGPGASVTQVKFWQLGSTAPTPSQEGTHQMCH